MEDVEGTTGCPGSGQMYDHFTDSEELESLVEELASICGNNSALERSQERFIGIVDKYQEQPHLMDPYLEGAITRLLALGRKDGAPATLVRQAYGYVRLIAKTRGPKVVLRWFPHEVADLEPVLDMLEAQDHTDHQSWEVRYVLLLWLSILVLIPFNLSRMDGTAPGGGGGGQHRTVDRVFVLARRYLGAEDKCQDAASYLVSKFLSRPDVKGLRLPAFMDWCLSTLHNTDRSTIHGVIVLRGALGALASLFKYAKRCDVVDFAPSVLEHLSNCRFASSDNILIRKLNIKVIQRLGMAFLQVRVASWRYQRGSRSLELTLASAVAPARPLPPQAGEEDEGFDVPEELEEVLAQLMVGLRDRDTVVRWSAAKGVGRVTGRLPKELADQVVGSLLEFFNERERHSAWHGGCLALAELGRRGLLLPERLSSVVSVVLKALVFEERMGGYSIGSHVRDAACYVCWSFARAYDPQELAPFVKDLAVGLVTTAVFDREVTCRKAASAAFQENVGRLGTLPHGIEVFTAADYYSVSVTRRVYLSISVHIAQYPEYCRPLIDHLVEHKLCHWDSSLRELAAEALHNLTQRDPLYMKDNVLPSLLATLTTSADPSLRHGALCAVAELAHALYLHLTPAHRPSFHDNLGHSVTSTLLLTVPKLLGAEAFKGSVGESLRPAVLRFIQKMSYCQFPPSCLKDVVGVWQLVVDENLPHTERRISEAAVSALTALCVHCYCPNEQLLIAVQGQLVTRYTRALDSHDHFIRMGGALALGCLPCQLLQGKLCEILSKLCSVAESIEGQPAKFTEPRRDAVSAISNVCVSVGVASGGSPEQHVCEANLPSVYRSMLAASQDYTIDSRGDIGRLVREAAMDALLRLTLLLATDHQSLLNADIVERVMCSLVQQSNEKIDKTRAVALNSLTQLLYHQPPVPYIPHHRALMSIFNKEATESINWSVAESSFPLSGQLLSLPAYCYPTLLGMAASVGCFTESTVQYSSSSLLHCLKGISSCQSQLEYFCDVVLSMYRDHMKNNRVIAPLLVTLDVLLSNGIFDACLQYRHPFPLEVFSLVTVSSRSTNMSKTLASVDVLCDLLQFPDVKTQSLKRISVLLCHPYPKVRKRTAEQLYTTIATYDDIVGESVFEQVLSILSDNPWGAGDRLPALKQERNALCGLLGLPIPSMSMKTSAEKTVRDDLASYKDLVDRSGY